MRSVITGVLPRSAFRTAENNLKIDNVKFFGVKSNTCHANFARKRQTIPFAGSRQLDSQQKEDSMSGFTIRQPLALGKRGMLLLGALLACVALYFAVAASAASAEEFCERVTLQPYGHSGDRCTAPQGHWNYYVVVQTYERAGCEDTENNGVLLTAGRALGATRPVARTTIPASGHTGSLEIII
jgi:hypothetical protein